MQKSEASENWLNKILQYGRFGNNVKKINTKLQMLQITRNECPQILQRSKIRQLEKHLQMLEERLKKVHELKGKIQELRKEQEENMEEIEKWTSKHETEVQEYYAPIEELQNQIMVLKQRESQERKVEVD